MNTSVICYVVTWMKTLSLSVLSFTTTALSHCYSLLSAFCILSHFKIIRCIMKSLTVTSANFLLKYNWKRKLKIFLGAQTSIPVYSALSDFWYWLNLFLDKALQRYKNLYFHILLYETQVCFLLQKNEGNSDNKNHRGV